MKYQALFWILVATAILLVVAIFVMAGSIKTILKLRSKSNGNQSNDSFKKVIKTLLLLLGVTFTGSLFAGAPEQPSPIYEPDFSDVLGMTIVNSLLLFVFLYFRNVFNTLANDLLPAKLVKEKSPWFKLNKILVDAVEIEHEKDILMDHEYDGIRELDNNLPPWWKWGFYATIVFAFIYIGHYHVFKTGNLQIAEFEQSNIEAEIAIEAFKKEQNLNVDENTAVFMTEASDLNEGKKLFAENCVSCHGPSGEGGIGANLTDDYWLYGNDIKNIFSTIKYGAKNGMRSWNDDFNGVQIQQISSFVATFQGSNVVGGKEAQGDFFERVAP